MSRILLRSVPIVLVAVLSGTALMAAGQTTDADAGRYTMHKTEDGLVRLDTRTGALALCRKRDAGWSCRSIADADTTTESDVERLRRENAELRAEVKRLDELLGLSGRSGSNRADPPPPGGKSHAFRLPSEKEVDDALDYFETMLRKFRDRLKKLESERGDSKEL